ncbi:DUF3027 domain-containing protein [Arthrobacter sp. CDRTa11]|uniref:DUF3027 domain-containing protein n=1 Tax=Arthrobacter sp. CDRTa11 TaxID=2651199 RepID=UPI0023770144|nr:DUF3027 domain-containing protein [Arthrobacter sp. CDRTa11]
MTPTDAGTTDAAPTDATADAATAAKPGAARRAAVPVWRTGKPDAFLAAAVDVARTAIEGITAASDIGQHVAARSEGDRLVTHLFESKLPGYQGWQWYAVLTRNSRSKVVTVNELGLLPSEDSILAPEWVPWAERVRPEDAQEAEAAGQAVPATEAPVDDLEDVDQDDADQGGDADQDSPSPDDTHQDDADQDDAYQVGDHDADQDDADESPAGGAH